MGHNDRAAEATGRAMTPEPVSALIWMLQGFLYPFRGLVFVARHRRLLWYLVIPVSLNALLFTAFLWLAVPRAWRTAAEYLPGQDTWYGVAIYYLAAVLLILVLAVLIIYAFTLVGNIILGPFNDMLSNTIERMYTGSGHEDAFTLKTALADILRSIRVEIGKLLMYLTGLVLLLSLNLLPLAGNILSGVLIVLYTMFFLGWEYIDYSMERWKFTFRRKRKTAAANAPALIGFGAGASLMLFIPLVNLLAIPLCAAGATLLFCDLRKHQRLADTA